MTPKKRRQPIKTSDGGILQVYYPFKRADKDVRDATIEDIRNIPTPMRWVIHVDYNGDGMFTIDTHFVGNQTACEKLMTQMRKAIRISNPKVRIKCHVLKDAEWLLGVWGDGRG